jgi:hypothetical protein
MYGHNWWDVDPVVKKQRQNEAMKTLSEEPVTMQETKASGGKIPTNADTEIDTEKNDIEFLLNVVVKRLPKAKDVKIEKLHSSLLSCYNALKDAMDAPNEKRWLFHGTSEEVVSNIVAEGFNRSFCGKNATVFGKGVYFALDIHYSSHSVYSPPNAHGRKHIIASKVLVGDFCQGKYDQVAPDFKPNSTKRFDTTVNDEQYPTIYVAYKDMQAQPDYLITFVLR